jgi:hypothetical protein
MIEVTTMERKWIWIIPLLISLAVGFVLWDMNGFDVSRVAGDWGIIAVMMLAYGLIVASLPIAERNQDGMTEAATPVQRRYINVMSEKSVK